MQEITDPNLLAELNGGAPQPTAVPGFIPGRPKPVDPYKASGEQRDEIRTDIAVRGEVRDVDNTAFNQKDKLSERYSKLPEVKNYRVAVQQLAQAIDTGEGPQSDLALTYAFAKAMDPESVVRESEQGMVTGSQPWFTSAVEEAKKQFGMDGAGNYTPETRKQIRAQIANAVAQRNKLYNQQRDYFTELAKRNQFDPFEIVGEHDANPFAESIRTWGQGDQPTTKNPEMVGGIAKGTNVTFAGDNNTGFDRNRAVLEITGFDANGEANLVAWLGANSGNPNITKADVEEAYKRFSDGRSTGAVDDEFIQKLRSGKTPFQGFDTSFLENQYKIKAEQLAQERDTTGGAVDAYVRGAADTGSLGLADKGAALMDTIFEGGTYAENRDQQRLTNTADEIANPYARIAGQLTGAIAVPYGAGARTPAELAKVAAITGGATEFNSSDAPIGQRIVNTGVATVSNALLGYGTGKLVEAGAPVLNSLAQRMRGKAVDGIANDLAPEMSAPAFVAAAKRQDADYLAADIPGSYMTQMGTSVVDKTLGSKFIQQGSKKAVDSVERASQRVSTKLNNGEGAADSVGAGQQIQKGLNKWQETTDKKVGDLYDKIPINGSNAAKTDNTLSTLRSVNNPLSSNSALSSAISDPKLKVFQDALEKGGLSWDDLKAFRTYIGGKVGAPSMQSDIPKDRLRAIYAGLSADMEATAMAQGPDALKAFQRANSYNRGMEARRKNVFEALLGKNFDASPEESFKQLQRWASNSGGDFAKVAQSIRSLPEAEANGVRATIIDMLGKSKPGQQASDGSGFSTQTWATNWNNIAPRAKSILFQGQHRADLNDIAGISTAMKRADRYNNNSNTGVMIGGAATLGSFVANPLAPIAAVLAQVGAGVILGSPKAAKIVAAFVRNPNPKAEKALFARLDNLAKVEPAIADNVFQFQAKLRDAINGTPERLAASEGDQKAESLPLATPTTAREPQ